MRLRHLLPLLASTIVSQAEPNPLVIPDSPAAAANAVYCELRDRKVSGLPMGADWAAIEPRVTPALAKVIRAAHAEQAAYIKANPGEKPPFIEGDLFGSLFEGPQAFTIGEARIEGDKAEVPVACTHTEGADTAKWTDTLILLKTEKGWLLDDVRYGGTWDFSNQGTLKESLAPEE